jgi:phage shock protein A
MEIQDQLKRAKEALDQSLAKETQLHEELNELQRHLNSLQTENQ